MNITTKNLLFLALIVLLIPLISSCARNPTNNPFDGKYNVSTKKLQQNGYYELESADEFWGYEKTFDERYSVGYVYFADAPRVNGKDFIYYIDTVVLNVRPSEMASKEGLALVDSFHHSPWPVSTFEGTLMVMDCELMSVNKDEVMVFSNELEQSIPLRKITDVKPMPSGEQVMLVRSLNGFIANPYFGDPPLGLQILEGVLIGTVIVAATIADDDEDYEADCE